MNTLLSAIFGCCTYDFYKIFIKLTAVFRLHLNYNNFSFMYESTIEHYTREFGECRPCLTLPLLCLNVVINSLCYLTKLFLKQFVIASGLVSKLSSIFTDKQPKNFLFLRSQLPVVFVKIFDLAVDKSNRIFFIFHTKANFL